MSESGTPEPLGSSECIFEGRVIRVRRDRVRLPDGSDCYREVVEHRGAVGIVPLLDDGAVVLITQYRYAVGEWLLEIPAGTLEEGEDPEWCAARELEEETGYTARRFRRLFAMYVSPGYCNELLHIYVAEGLVAGQARPDCDEAIETTVVPLSSVSAMIQEGRIRDAKTIAALLAVMAGS